MVPALSLAPVRRPRLRIYDPAAHLTKTLDLAIQRYKDLAHEKLMAHCEADPTTGCTVWTGARQKKTGLGVVRIMGKMFTVARVAYWVYRGDSENFDLFDMSFRVLHTVCKNRCCLNWEHLSCVQSNQVSTHLSELGRARGGRVQTA